jgi:AraC-like DNA-binding protein
MPARSADDLAQDVGLRRSRLDELFKQQFGLSLGDYIRERRLKLAVKLLASSEKEIKQIAADVGYCHTSSFMRFFKRKFGMTPGRYRKSIGKTAN